MNGSDTFAAVESARAAPLETLDPKLISWYREAHARKRQFQGLSVLTYADQIGRMIRGVNAVTLLDYGCGQGLQYTEHKLHERWGVPMPALYDPGVPALEAKPAGTFDGVICSDVLEHVPEELVANVLCELFGYARSFVWLSVCCRPAKKKFPDGRNLHVTVKDQAWWARRVRKFAREIPTQLVFTP